MECLGSFAVLPDASQKVLAIYSDMRQATTDLNLERDKRFQGSAVITLNKLRGLIANLKNVQVYVLGASSASDRIAGARRLERFWQAYFFEAGANLQAYSVLRDWPVGPPRLPRNSEHGSSAGSEYTRNRRCV